MTETSAWVITFKNNNNKFLSDNHLLTGLVQELQKTLEKLFSPGKIRRRLGKLLFIHLFMRRNVL